MSFSNIMQWKDFVTFKRHELGKFMTRQSIVNLICIWRAGQWAESDGKLLIASTWLDHSEIPSTFFPADILVGRAATLEVVSINLSFDCEQLEAQSFALGVSWLELIISCLVEEWLIVQKHDLNKPAVKICGWALSCWCIIAFEGCAPWLASASGYLEMWDLAWWAPLTLGISSDEFIVFVALWVDAQVLLFVGLLLRLALLADVVESTLVLMLDNSL